MYNIEHSFNKLKCLVETKNKFPPKSVVKLLYNYREIFTQDRHLQFPPQIESSLISCRTPSTWQGMNQVIRIL